MYCEKCGKMNDDGAIFCSNCSSILRSRRKTSAPAEGSTRRFSVPDDVEVKKETPSVRPAAEKVVRTAEPKPVVPPVSRERAERSFVSEDAPRRVVHTPDDRYSARAGREYGRVEYDEYDESEDYKTDSVWFWLLSGTSWLIFIAFAAVGIVGGSYLLKLGMSDGQAQIFSYAGGAVIILMVVIGLYILSKNMVKIKMARALNELKYKK